MVILEDNRFNLQSFEVAGQNTIVTSHPIQQEAVTVWAMHEIRRKKKRVAAYHCLRTLRGRLTVELSGS